MAPLHPQSRHRHWQSYLTIDTLLSLSFLPIPVALSLPLLSILSSSSSSSSSSSLSSSPTLASLSSSPTLPYTASVAIVFTLLHLFSFVNNYFAHGGGPARPLDWSREVVVITGGASGLGRLVAGIFGMRGASVAVLDVKEIEGGDEESLGDGVKWYRCDVGSFEAVRKVGEKIEKDLGVPTILINNAGIVNGKPLLSLSPEAVERNFRINLLSHYHTIQTFLPGMLNRPTGGTVVTVSSVLGELGASHLSDYAAAKAGLIAMHASLRSELASMAALPDAQPGAKNIRTVLVKPGQLSTHMFGSIETPNSFFGPVVEGVELANAIVRAVDDGKNAVIAMPLYARYIEWMGILPYSLQRFARWASGVDRAMEKFSAS